ncbi:MAG: Ig-like domain-containing protein [candidate division WOR-3 bacterium]|nr:MAG: Ig-like domain-containing protein [candidate division WOR-3 bacterium]
MRRPAAVTLLAVLVGAGILALSACAKKMLPPSPDRFAPRLLEIRTRNRVSVELLFDEDIDARSASLDSIAVFGPDGERVELRGISMGRKSDRIDIWTWPQSSGLFEVRGRVLDQAGNPGRFRGRFRGSDKADTIRPRVAGIQPRPGASGAARQKIAVQFSEPLDTLSQLSYTFVPSMFDTVYQGGWREDWRELSFVPADTIDSGVTVYFVLHPSGQDLEGNRLSGSAFTYFTPDSVFEGRPVRGRVTWRGPLGTGLVLFEDTATTGMAPILTDGSFGTRLDSGSYQAIAVADTNSDGAVDLVGGPVEFQTEQESLAIRLEPTQDSIPRTIDAYRR